MKIFVDAHFLDGQKHGVANFLERLYLHYIDLGSDHEIYFGIEPNAPTDYPLFARPGVHVLRYRFGGVLRFLLDIPLLARNIKPDIIHTQYVLPLRAGYSAKRHVTIHDVLYEDYPELFGKVYRWSRTIIFGWSARHADILSTVSAYSRDRIRAIYRPKAGEIHVIHNGVMAEAPETDNKFSESFRGEFLLYVSRFEKRKNHLNLLKAFVQLLRERPQLRLVLVGFDADGTLAECDQFIAEHAIRSNIEMLSNISDSEITHLFRTASVVVYPSLCEGFGMPIIESMLLNPHTVFSNTTAMADFSFAPENTFDPTNVDAIVETIRTKLDARGYEPPEWPAQRRLIADKYNWGRSARVLLEIHEYPRT